MIRHKGDTNTTACPVCRQRVPLNPQGKIVAHTRTIQAVYKPGSRTECQGSGAFGGDGRG